MHTDKAKNSNKTDDATSSEGKTESGINDINLLNINNQEINDNNNLTTENELNLNNFETNNKKYMDSKQKSTGNNDSGESHLSDDLINHAEVEDQEKSLPNVLNDDKSLGNYRYDENLIKEEKSENINEMESNEKHPTEKENEASGVKDWLQNATISMLPTIRNASLKELATTTKNAEKGIMEECGTENSVHKNVSLIDDCIKQRNQTNNNTINTNSIKYADKRCLYDYRSDTMEKSAKNFTNEDTVEMEIRDKEVNKGTGNFMNELKNSSVELTSQKITNIASQDGNNTSSSNILHFIRINNTRTDDKCVSNSTILDSFWIWSQK